MFVKDVMKRNIVTVNENEHYSLTERGISMGFTIWNAIAALKKYEKAFFITCLKNDI